MKYEKSCGCIVLNKWFDIDKAIETCTYENSKDLLRQVKRDLNL